MPPVRSRILPRGVDALTALRRKGAMMRLGAYLCLAALILCAATGCFSQTAGVTTGKTTDEAVTAAAQREPKQSVPPRAEPPTAQPNRQAPSRFDPINTPLDYFFYPARVAIIYLGAGINCLGAGACHRPHLPAPSQE
jgi:hypothetical protein